MSRSNKSLGWMVLGFSLLAIYCAGKGAGEDQAAAVRAPAATTATPGEEPGSGHRKLALLVGVGDYKYARPRLHGPVNDVAEMKSVLTSPAYGFKEADVHVLTDAEAARDEILKELDDFLVRNAGPGDVVVFYFAGHGSLCDNPDDPTRQDNTLVPWDARDPEGRVGDIRDKELNARARRLSEQVGDTGGVTFILDSCHSGTGIRAAGTPRSLEKGPRCGPRRAILSTESSGYGDDSLRYVLIAGSRTDQTSFERPSADGKTRGALTENLVQELLRPSAVRRTYRDIMNRVIPAVQGEYTNQIPQLEGKNRDQVVFGTDTIETRNYVLASAVTGGQVRIEGGQLHGFTKGSQFDIYGPEAHTFEAPEQPLTRATLGDPAALSSFATMSPVVPIPLGAKAVERLHNFEAQKTRILYDGLGRSAALRQLAETLEQAEDDPFEQVAAGQPFRIRVAEEGGVIRTFGADGVELSKGLPVTTPGLATRLQKRILDWTRWFGLIGLRNRTTDDLVQVALLPNGGTPSPSSPPAFTPSDQAFNIRVKNLTNRKLFVYILDLPSDGSSRLVYPDPGSHVPLEARQEVVIDDWNVRKPDDVAYIRDVFKVIVASQQIELQYLEAGKPRSAPPDPLNQLLLDSAIGVRHASRSVAVGWGTADLSFEVCAELDRSGRCVRPASDAP